MHFDAFLLPFHAVRLIPSRQSRPPLRKVSAPTSPHFELYKHSFASHRFPATQPQTLARTFSHSTLCIQLPVTVSITVEPFFSSPLTCICNQSNAAGPGLQGRASQDTIGNLNNRSI